MRSNPPVAVCVILLAACFAATPLRAQDSIPSVLERLGTLRSRRVQESSGVALSRHHPGVIWTHNDSGDKPMIYAINSAGDVLAVVKVTNARATDWEDLSLAQCPEGNSACLYIGDTGDNSERRRFASLFVIPEPDPALARAPGDTLESVPAREVRFTYADGPHDVEAIYVDGAGNASLVTKGRSGRVVRYQIPRADLLKDSAVARPADTLAIGPALRTLGRMVTGAAISPSGRRVVVRTYSELYFFRRRDDGHLVPDGFPCWLGAAEPQGEGVTFVDEATVILTSESLPNQDSPILRVRCSRAPR